MENNQREITHKILKPVMVLVHDTSSDHAQ